MDYPGKYNNDNKENAEIFKDKVVLNQPAGNLEFINTKDSESVTLTHKNGSFDKMNKFGKDELVTRDKREHVMGDSLEAVNGRKTIIIDEDEEKIVLGDILSTVGDADKWQEPMMNIKKEQKELHDVKRLFETKRTKKHNDIDQAPSQTKSGSHAKCPTNENKSKMIYNSSPTKVTNTKVNSRKVIKVEDGSEEYKEVSGSGTNRCLTCWGKMLSPSSQDGKWATETEKSKIVQKRVEIQKKIYEYEKQLGQNKHPNGGTSVQTVAKNFIQNIGLVFNDFESYRKDPIGKLVPCGVKIDPLGTTIYTQYRESALVEQVDVEKFPGGSYNLNVCDGWTATVGSNGIEFKTTGPLNLFGPQVNLIGQTINVGAKDEVTVEGDRVDITGDIISLRPRKNKRDTETGANTEDEQQVLIDGNLNVGLNAIIRGGAHIEGELSVQHITAPAEYHVTETDFTYGVQQEPKVLPPTGDLCYYGENGKHVDLEPDECTDEAQKSPTYATLLPGALIGYAVGTDSNGDKHCLEVYSLKSENFAVVDQHVHYFKNIASKLFEKSSQVDATVGSIKGSGSANAHDAVRTVGARNNWDKPVLAQPVKNSKTNNTVVQKFGGSCEPVTINKQDWENASAKEDSLPDGEGVRTKKYTDEKLKEKIKSIEADLESKYTEIKQALAEVSNQNC